MSNRPGWFALAFFFVRSVALADGPPISNGHISVPHQVLTLTDAQVDQASRLQLVALTSAQKKALHAIAKVEVPALLDLITAPYNDCACGLGFYGLWVDRTTVEIPNWALESVAEEDEEELDGPRPRTLDEAAAASAPSTLVIGLDGSIYQRGRIVNNLKTARAAMGGERWVWVYTPPLIDLERVKNSYSNIVRYFQGEGFEVSAYFAREYIEAAKEGWGELPAYTATRSGEPRDEPANGCALGCGTTWKLAASSEGRWRNHRYPASHMRDGSTETAWVEGVPGYGINETLRFSDFRAKAGGTVSINGLVLRNGYQKSPKTFAENARVKSAVLLKNDQSLYLLQLLDVKGSQEVRFPTVVLTPTDRLTLRIVDVYGGLKYQDTAVTSLWPEFVE